MKLPFDKAISRCDEPKYISAELSFNLAYNKLHYSFHMYLVPVQQMVYQDQQGHECFDRNLGHLPMTMGFLKITIFFSRKYQNSSTTYIINSR